MNTADEPSEYTITGTITYEVVVSVRERVTALDPEEAREMVLDLVGPIVLGDAETVFLDDDLVIQPVPLPVELSPADLMRQLHCTPLPGFEDEALIGEGSSS